jgi:hypothetical protein
MRRKRQDYYIPELCKRVRECEKHKEARPISDGLAVKGSGSRGANGAGHTL